MEIKQLLKLGHKKSCLTEALAFARGKPPAYGKPARREAGEEVLQPLSLSSLPLTFLRDSLLWLKLIRNKAEEVLLMKSTQIALAGNRS